MNGYLISVVGTVLLCALLTAILPDGKTANLIKAIAKLSCLVAIVAPIPTFLQQGNGEESDKTLQNFFEESGIQTDANFIQYYSEWRIEQAEKELEKLLLNEYDFSAKITLDWEYFKETVNGLYENKEIKIRRVCIVTAESDAVKCAQVVHYIKKNYCSEVLLE